MNISKTVETLRVRRIEVMDENNDRHLATITFTPADIDVSDDRGRVFGSLIHLDIGGDLYAGTMIPPEGTSIDCWLDLNFPIPSWWETDEDIDEQCVLEVIKDYARC